ncbi:MAG TPA: hypothetical protein V6D05_00325, partial [Stenomitos sp.]
AGDTGTIPLTPLAAPYNLDDWAFLNDPQGVAIDTAGNCFITSQTNNVIYRVDTVRHMVAFTTMASPKSVARDSAGNLYVCDKSRAAIRRITLAGDQRTYAYGLASLTGVAADDSSNLYVGLSGSGAVLKLSSDGVTTSPLLSGIAPPYGLTYRNGKILIAHTDTNSVTEVTLSTGAARSAVTAGLKYPAGAEVSDDGSTYYVGRLNLWDSYWDAPDASDPWTNSGVDFITNGTRTQYRTAIHGTRAYEHGQTLWRMDANNFLLADRDRRTLHLFTAIGGQTYSQSLKNVTPPFGGSRVFPGAVYDLVYDGARYAYAACGDKNVYRIDTQNFAAEAVAITGLTGTPYGLTYTGGALYVVDRTNKQVRRISAPSTATTVDDAGTWVAAAGTGPMGLTNFGGSLYVSDYDGYQILKIDPAAPGSPQTYINGLAGKPSRLRNYNDGRLLVRCSDGYIYTISTATPPVASQYSGTGNPEFYLDGSNNLFYAWIPYTHQIAYAFGILNTRELARDGTDPTGNWLYVGTSNGVFGINLTSGVDELSFGNIGTAYGVAVSPTSHLLYALNSSGRIYEINKSTGLVTNPVNLPAAGWGLEYDATSAKLYAVCKGNSIVYRVDPANWAGGASPIKMGLHNPEF